ncbi:MAG: hypothetical protein BHW29_00895 [Faecalibacterium sp. CAG:74_58_120]|nr:MAG: hypothetical protein BHW29_00895 [Faecalibacterium sp. CAG:74_58_120]
MPNTGRNYRHPPAIHHIGRRDENHAQTVRQAAKVVRLPDRATKLLTFYADCPDGFFPALKTVHDATGMDRKDIYKARKELVDVGFILYTPEEIRIDWQRVATMAMLPPEACFSLRRRSMPERAKVEKIKPAFWKREPMKWTTPIVCVVYPDGRKIFHSNMEDDRPKLGNRRTAFSHVIQWEMTAENWTTCRIARIHRLLITLYGGVKINLPSCGIYHRK